MPKPILSGCCASAAPASASPMNRAPSTRLKVFRTLLPSMVPPRFSLSGDYESALLFVKRYPLPQALAALELGEHLDLEFPRPEAEARALDPAVAAGGAGAALPRSVRHGDRVDGHHRAAAALVFFSAAAGAGIVSSDGHEEESSACARLAARAPCRSPSSSSCRCYRASRIAAARCWCLWTRCISARTPSWSAFSPPCMRSFRCCSRCTRAGSPTASACATRSCSARWASRRDRKSVV